MSNEHLTTTKGYSESEDHVADPTAMSGTIDTTGTSGVTTTAADVSPVFDLADRQAAKNVETEGVANLAPADPAASGEDALEPDPDAQAAVPNVLSDEDRAAAKERAQATLDAQDKTQVEKAQESGSETKAEKAKEAKDSNGSTGEGPKVADSKANDSFDASKDPSDFTVAQVKEFLDSDSTSDADKKKVLAAEKKGKARAGLLN